MATTIHRVFDNFDYRIGQLTPTNQTKRNRFTSHDPIQEEEPKGDGGIRKFFGEWMGSGSDLDATDISAREAVHAFTLTVLYPTVLRFRELKAMVLQDRHDLIRQLRDPGKWVGYAGSPTTDVGIMLRQRIADTLDKANEAYWRLIIRWAVKVRELE